MTKFGTAWKASMNVPLPLVLVNSTLNATVHADPEGGGQDDRRVHCDVGLDLQATSFGDFS